MATRFALVGVAFPGYTALVIRSYRYRLRPTRSQERKLLAWLDGTREVFNAALQNRRDAWKMAGERVTAFDQMAELADIRKDREDIGAIPSVVLRGAIRRLDKAFSAFFRRVKSGEKPGYPRFKSGFRWHTLDIDDLGKSNPLEVEKRRVKVPLLGWVKVSLHRVLKGTPKALRLTHDSQGRWWVTFQCVDVPTNPLPVVNREIGIDLGLSCLVATSDGEKIENPRSLRTVEAEVKRAQRRVSRRKKGGKRRQKAVRQLARKHERVANVRREHAIRTARKIVRENDVIYVEALNVKGLASGMLAKSVHDAGWAILLHWIRVKAESAGREVVAVNPAGTSQTCPACDRVKAKSLGERVHRCPCGCILDRDVAAAQVILSRGARDRGGAPGCRTPMIREAQVPVQGSDHNTFAGASRAAGQCPVGAK